MKQTTLEHWVKKPTPNISSKVVKLPPKSLRITLDIDSSIHDHKDILAEIEGDKIALYIKQKQIPLYIAKMSKDEFLELCQLDDNLSPAMVKKILPELDDALILSLCQFLISQRYKKLESQKVTLFSF